MERCALSLMSKWLQSDIITLGYCVLGSTWILFKFGPHTYSNNGGNGENMYNYALLQPRNNYTCGLPFKVLVCSLDQKLN